MRHIQSRLFSELLNSCSAKVIYIHIPFCRSFCTYCSFYSELAHCDAAFDRFADVLCSEIRHRSGEVTEEVNTLYIGGGTPSVLPLSVLSRIVGTLEGLGFRDFDEFTVEVNPDDIVAKGHDYVEGLLRLGVNRVSMGVQSFDDGVLRWMNRRHDAGTAVKAYRMLRSCGVDNISIDLIFGLGSVPGTVPPEERWNRTMEQALDIAGEGILPKHISAYQLSVEEGSALSDMAASGRWTEASDEECSRQYDGLCRFLHDAGYRHYEISNFALPGYEAVHNSAYWRYVPYSGFGPGAHSFLYKDGSPVRRWNSPDVKAYIDAFAGGSETLTAEQVRIEKIMLALRTDSGIGREYLESNASADTVSSLLRSGLLVPAGEDRLRIPEARFFISDTIISELI